MNRTSILLFVGAVAVTGMAFAHGGVKDPQVMARMNLMSAVAKDMKTLGGMAKATFDPTIAATLGNQLADHATQIEALFETPATDPKTEAKDTVWSDWDGFLKAADLMRDAAVAVSDSTSKEAFQDAFARLGDSCKTCHQDYRINKN